MSMMPKFCFLYFIVFYIGFYIDIFHDFIFKKKYIICSEGMLKITDELYSILLMMMCFVRVEYGCNKSIIHCNAVYSFNTFCYCTPNLVWSISKEWLKR